MSADNDYFEKPPIEDVMRIVNGFTFPDHKIIPRYKRRKKKRDGKYTKRRNK